MRVISLASGSSGNCTVVTGAQGHLLIDAGISMTRIKKSLASLEINIEDISGVLVTHEHSDHISGLTMLLKHFQIPVFAPRTVAQSICQTVAGAKDSLRVISVGEDFALGGFNVKAFHTSHDTEESVGYRIEGDGIFGFATDTGCVTEEVLQGLLGADTVVIESNHDEEMLKNGHYPYFLKRRVLSKNGHLSNRDCAILARVLEENGTAVIALGHLSRDNNTPQLAFDTVTSELCGKAQVCVLPRSEMLELEVGGCRKCLV